MALIHCPECGAQVSDSAKSCVRCGCGFTICPECKEIYAGKPEVCKKCGFSFGKDNLADAAHMAAVDESENPEPKKEDYVSLWRKSSPKYANAKKIEQSARVGLHVLNIALLVLAVIKFSNWVNGDPLVGIAMADQTFSSLKGYIVYVCIIEWISGAMGAVWKSYEYISLSNWLYEKKIDSVEGMRKYFESKGEKEEKDVELFVAAAYLKAKPTARSGYYAYSVLRTLCHLGFAICFAIILTNNLEYYMMATVVASKPFLYQLDALVPMLVFLLLEGFIHFYGLHRMHKRERAWRDAALPQLKKMQEEQIDEILDHM